MKDVKQSVISEYSELIGSLDVLAPSEILLKQVVVRRTNLISSSRGKHKNYHENILRAEVKYFIFYFRQ